MKPRYPNVTGGDFKVLDMATKKEATKQEATLKVMGSIPFEWANASDLA